MDMSMEHPLALICLELLLSVLVLLHKCDSLVVAGGETLLLGDSLTGNQTIKSKNGTFELGFFSPNGTNNWYLGIWYAEKTIVWVANRQTPLTSMQAVLKLSTDGYLEVSDLEGRLIWSTIKNQRGKASKALLLESGNFVLLGAHNTSQIVWESFGYPGDTWLPGMKLWKGMKLTCWKSWVDPAAGPYSLAMDTFPGKTQLLLLYKDNVSYFSGGEWTGHGFSNLPEMGNSGEDGLMKFVKISPSIMYFTYGVKSDIQRMMPRIIVHQTGEVRAYIWIYNSRWSFIWSEPRDQCRVYGVCGAYGTCNSNNIQFCSCLQGFTPKDSRAWDSQIWWSSGCVRRRPLQCSSPNGTIDGFLQLSNTSLPDGNTVSYTERHTVKDCQTACLSNCSCTAFAFTNSTPPMCRLWFGDLLNMRNSSDGQSLFIRLAASELPLSSSPSKGKRGRVPALSILFPAGFAFTAVLALVFGAFIRWRHHRVPKKSTEHDVPTSLRTFTYKELQIATKKFRHKLGRGAFGSVFKGTLPDNTLVAVKKLEGSRRAEKQFRAEISTIGNVQHVNLVRLWGFCAEGSKRLLVYEYMPNGSLNSMLFRNCKSEGTQMVLEWKTRFEIALGTARGLYYLHEKCRDRIIHCDIKPENILLDSNLCAKVADFGMAKLVGRDLSRVLTTTRGTRGYLAPEWISGLPITPKADVYSFGMTLLEIISGRRNLDLNVESSRLYFPTWAATQVHNGNIMGIVDERIANSADTEEVRRAVAVGQLCIQNDENLRPNMYQVVQILEGNIEVEIPQIQRSLQGGGGNGDSSDSYFIF